MYLITNFGRHETMAKNKNKPEIIIDENYDFFPNTFTFRFMRRLLKVFLKTISPAYFKIFFGLRVYGKKNMKKVKGRGVITISNHAHGFDDIISLAKCKRLDFHYPTLLSNFSLPYRGKMLQWLGGIPVSHGTKALRLYNEACETVIKNGHLIHINPEAILREYATDMLEFKKGAFLYSYNCNTPIVPYVFTYRKPRGLMKKLRKKPYLNLTMFPPMYPNTDAPRRAEIERFRNECYNLMNDHFTKSFEEFGGFGDVQAKNKNI